MEKKMKKKAMLKKVILAAGTLLAACGLFFGPSLLAGSENAASAEAIEMPTFSVRTQEAVQQTLRAFLDVNGDIVSTQQVEVFPDVAGRLISLQVSLGSYVRAGDIIAEIDASRPGATFMNSPVTAPISGIVSRTPLPVGSTVGPASSITSISANGGNLEISARIPEREIAGLSPGLKAEVSLQAYPGETFTATVSRVSPIVDSSSRTKLINLRFDQVDHRINPGMFARVRINTRSYSNVLTVPTEAIVSYRGVQTVFVVNHNNADLPGSIPTAIRREVSSGVTLQGWTEITSGLERQSISLQPLRGLSWPEKRSPRKSSSSRGLPSGERKA